MRSGAIDASFGEVDVAGIDRPLTLSYDGSIAVTVERDGSVRPSLLARRLAVAPDATRMAMRIAAEPGVPTTRSIIDLDLDLDLDVGSWVDRACAADPNGFGCLLRSRDE